MDIDRHFTWGAFDEYHVGWDYAGNAPDRIAYVKPGRAPKADGSAPRPGAQQLYRPFDEPALYRRFARIALEPPTTAAILRFAGRYGALTGARAVSETQRPGDDELTGWMEQLPTPGTDPQTPLLAYIPGTDPPAPLLFDSRRFVVPVPEPVSLWEREVHVMSAIIAAFDMCRDEPLGLELPASDTLRLSVPTGSRRTVATLMAVVHETLVSKLTEYTEATLGPLSEGEPNQADFNLVVMPMHLLGALWLQLADAVERGARYRPCAVCGSEFEIKDGRSKGRRYCSGACKKRGQRTRNTRHEIAT